MITRPEMLPFPLDAMPNSLKTLAVHAASQHGSPPGVAFMALLSAIGAAVGRTVTLMPWPGLEIPAALNVVFSATKRSTPRLVERAFAAILLNQSRRGQEFCKRSRPWLQQEYLRLIAERGDYWKQIPRDRWSDPTPFDERLAGIEAIRCPCVLHDTAVNDIRGGTGASGFQTRLLTNAARASQHIHEWTLPWRAGSCARPCSGFQGPGRSCSPCSGSDVVVANQVEVERFLGAGRTASWLSAELLFVSDRDPAPREAGNTQDEQEREFQNHWDDLMNRLFDQRLARKNSVVEPTPEALGILNAVLRTTPVIFSELPADRQGVSILWPQQVQRLALAIHLACESTGQLSVATARATSALAEWLAVQQVIAGFPQCIGSRESDEDESRSRNSFATAL